MHKVLLVLT